MQLKQGIDIYMYLLLLLQMLFWTFGTFQVHFASFLENMEESVKELNRQVSLGRIKYYGVSNFGPVNMKSFVEAGGKPVSNQVNLNDRCY